MKQPLVRRGENETGSEHGYGSEHGTGTGVESETGTGSETGSGSNGIGSGRLIESRTVSETCHAELCWCF